MIRLDCLCARLLSPLRTDVAHIPHRTFEFSLAQQQGECEFVSLVGGVAGDVQCLAPVVLYRPARAADLDNWRSLLAEHEPQLYAPADASAAAILAPIALDVLKAQTAQELPDLLVLPEQLPEQKSVAPAAALSFAARNSIDVDVVSRALQTRQAQLNGSTSISCRVTRLHFTDKELIVHCTTEGGCAHPLFCVLIALFRLQDLSSCATLSSRAWCS